MGKHYFDQVDYPKTTSPAGHFMIADKLAYTMSTAVLWFPLAFFPVSGYLGTVTMGALDVYGG
jgi:hypothetical protein